MNKWQVTIAMAGFLGIADSACGEGTFSVLDGVESTALDATEMEAVQGRATPITIPNVYNSLYTYYNYSYPYGGYPYGGMYSYYGTAYYTTPIRVVADAPLPIP